jgi:hypothetical protein
VIGSRPVESKEFCELETGLIDIPDSWALTPTDLALDMAKNEANRADFALLLLFYPAHGRFPTEPEDIEPGAVASMGPRP